MEIKKEYSNGEITIVWQPKLCIHAGVCVRELPKVYHPKEKPWITPENASTEELIAQIEQCPTSALSYYRNNEKNEKGTAPNNQTIVDVTKNGPLLVKGNVEIRDCNNQIIGTEKVTAFCRCGASKNKPFCDGMHSKINFNDEV